MMVRHIAFGGLREELSRQQELWQRSKMGSFEITKINMTRTEWASLSGMGFVTIYYQLRPLVSIQIIATCFFTASSCPNNFLHLSFLAFEIRFPVWGLVFYFCEKICIFNFLYSFDIVVWFNSFDNRTSAEGLEDFIKNKMKC